MGEANLEEEKVVVTPDMKEDPVSTDAQHSNDLAKSEILQDSNVESSKSQPSKDLSNSESKPNEELPSYTLATSGDTGTLPNRELDNSKEPLKNSPENSESLTSNQPDNAEASQNSQPVNSNVPPTDQSADCEAPYDDQLVSSNAPPNQKASEPSYQLVNSEALPNNNAGLRKDMREAILEEDKVVVTPEMKEDPVSTDTQPSNDIAKSEILPDSNVESSESQPIKDLSNSESMPNEELRSDTLATSGDSGSSPNHEFDNSKEAPNNPPENSESLTSNQPDNAEALQNNSQPVNSDIPPTDQSADCEAPYDDQLVSSNTPPDQNSEALPNNNAGLRKDMREANLEEDKVAVTPDMKEDPVSPDAQPSNDLAKSETLPDSNMECSESQPSKDLSNSESKPNEELPSDTLATSGNTVTLPNHELDNSKKPPNNPPENFESLTSNQPDNAEASQKSQPVNSDAPPTDQSADSEAPYDNQLVSSNASPDQKASEPSYQLANSEALPNNNVGNSEIQTDNEMLVSETQCSNEVVMSETQQSNDVVVSDTQPSNEANMPEAQTCDDVVMSEAIPENESANPITDPNIQISHSETLLDNQFTNFEMIPEDQLPQPESLPHSEPPPNSEPLADNHLTDIKPVLHNHLTHYETVPNNHLNHSEAFSDHHLANSEALSHDQLANSQMFTHYELENNDTMHSNQLVNSQAHYELAISNALPSYEIINAETPLNNEERTPETQPSKRRKKKSIVWEHFRIETVSPGCRRARCNQCEQTFAYSTGSKVAGTSHLKRHIAKGTCSAILRNQEHNQSNPYTPRTRGSGAGNASDPPKKRRYRSPSTPYIIFDQDHCRHEIARMIIMHDYPLHMVEHPGFVAFVQNLQPQFKMVTFNTIQGDCVATYLMEKQNLLKYFEGLPGRVCLTLDIWTSSQSLGYVFITGHFVDNDWKLQRRILNVVMEPYPDSDSALSHAVAVCLSDWGLEGRLFSVTCNRALNEVALENLRPLLSVKNTLILNGQLLVGNCIARTLSSVAQDLLSSAQDLINKIRDSVKYVKTSESHEEKFLELKQQLQVPSDRSLLIDDQIQWNTTYQMLVAASELKEVFSCLDTFDPDYKGAPSRQDWKLVETLCAYLKPLFDAANILTTTTHPTAITFFHEVWKLQLDVGRAVMSEDPFISNLNKIMHEKIDKYWRDCSLVLALAVVMDPRFKMKLVEFSFTKIHGDDAHMYIKIVEDGIHELFHEYVTLPLPLTPAYAEEGSAGSHSKRQEHPGGTLLSDSGLTDFDAYIMETTSHQMKSELDQYLEESLLPRVSDFDVLGWWKLNRVKYPTLSKMARDILSVPVSTVPPDSVFSTKSKEMDHYRCSLRPETVEALVCAKDWMQYGAAEASNALVKMVF